MSGDLWTIECEAHGSGQCDGFHYEGLHEGEPCGCPCHRTDNLPETIAGVKAWHDNLHGVTND